MPAANTPPTIRTTVSRFSRIGVNLRGLRVATQARTPVVAAPAVIALAMHCMHIS